MYLVFSFDNRDFSPFDPNVYLGSYLFLYTYDKEGLDRIVLQHLDKKGYYIWEDTDYFKWRFIIDTEYKHTDPTTIKLIREYKLNQLC